MTEANDGSIAEVVMNSVYFEIRKLRNILKRFLLSVVTCPTHYIPCSCFTARNQSIEALPRIASESR